MFFFIPRIRTRRVVYRTCRTKRTCTEPQEEPVQYTYPKVPIAMLVFAFIVLVLAPFIDSPWFMWVLMAALLVPFIAPMWMYLGRKEKPRRGFERLSERMWHSDRR